MAANSYATAQPFAAELSQAAQSLSDIFTTDHALRPAVELELKRAVAQLLEEASSEEEHIRRLDGAHAIIIKQQELLKEFTEMRSKIIRAIHQRYNELIRQYVNARQAFDQAIDRRALSPEVKAAAKAVLPSMPTGVVISNSFILAHLNDTQRKGQALLRVLLVAEKEA